MRSSDQKAMVKKKVKKRQYEIYSIYVEHSTQRERERERHTSYRCTCANRLKLLSVKLDALEQI